MRSSSRLPWLSNRQSSTFVALAENSAKLVPRPSHVAPSGCGEPAETCPLDLRNEKDGSKGWDNKAELRGVACHNSRYGTSVPDIAAAINCGIGIEHFAPCAGEGHAHAIIAQHLRREIDNHNTAL